MSSKRRRNVVRSGPVVGRDARREHLEAAIMEEPPETPTAAYEGPTPPSWMKRPKVVYNVRNQPVEWVDEWPYDEWAHRVGRAKGDLLILDRLSEEEDVNEAEPPSWMPHRTSRKTPLQVLNHPSERLDLATRLKYNLMDKPWVGKSWLRENARLHPEGLPAATPEEEEMRREARDITCSIAPWWDE
ncbi:hypothetical protein ACFTWH_08455 [Streptomyces sp. NPDC057011]|uniref:hypothetical protein n=1 Tax=unclassified Streptomyces TaxID=2593676 RepID=UPI003634A7C2